MSKQTLIQFIREELDRLVRRSAGFVGGMNIGKVSGEEVFAPPGLGPEETEDKETNEPQLGNGQRRQNGNERNRGGGNGRHPLQGKLRRSRRFDNPLR